MIKRSTPELFVENVAEAVRYYTEVLGFEPAGRVPEDKSAPAEWAQVQSGAASFMFEKKGEVKTDGVEFYLEVEDVSELADDLRAKGARITDGPTDMWYGMRNLTVLDNSGFRLIFASPIAATAPAKS